MYQEKQIIKSADLYVRAFISISILSYAYARQIHSQISTQRTTILESYDYEYDKNGNILSELHKSNWANATQINESIDYIYDKLGRLTKSVITDNLANSSTAHEYGYDRVGNKRLDKSGSNSEWSTYNGLNQLSQTELGLTTTNYDYDQNGNQKSEVTAGFAKEFEYDIDNRLIKVSTGTAIGSTPNVINTNTYRGDGQRISKTEKGVKTDYVYQGGTVLYTNNNNGDRTSFNYYSPDGGIIASKRYQGAQIGKYISYTKDIRTSTSTLLDDDGDYLSSYTYSDFGETKRIGNTTIPNEICYTGGIYDAATSLYYLNARHYDPANSRMLSLDTYRGERENPNSLNLYTYCENNPINFTDPTGHKKYSYSGERYIYHKSCKIGARLMVDWNVNSNKKISKVTVKFHEINYSWKNKSGKCTDWIPSTNRKITNNISKYYKNQRAHVTAKLVFQRKYVAAKLPVIPAYRSFSFDFWCYSDGGRDVETDTKFSFLKTKV